MSATKGPAISPIPDSLAGGCWVIITCLATAGAAVLAWLLPLGVVALHAGYVIYAAVLSLSYVLYLRISQRLGNTWELLRDRLFQVRYFAWIVFTVGLVAAIAAKLADPDISFSVFLDGFALDFIRLLIIWAIILFIVTLYGQHEELFKATENLATAVKKEFPEAVDALQKSEATTTFAASLVGLSVQINTLQAMSQQSKGLKSEVTSQLSNYTKDLMTELTSAHRGSSVDDIAFGALLKHYLSIEQLNLKPHGGNSRYQFSSSFVSYTLAVREIVEQLAKPYLVNGTYNGPYEFFTVLPRKPMNFFNLFNSVVPIGYSFNFVESFNRGFLCRYQIPYFRRFLYLDEWAKDGNERNEHIIKPWNWEDLNNRFVAICEVQSVRQCCVGCDPQAPGPHALLIDASTTDLNWLAGALGIATGTLTLLISQPPSHQYIIARESHPPNAQFKPVGEILRFYHVSNRHCKRKLLSQDVYEELYVKRSSIIPRDFMAVKYNGDWVYCIAAFFDSPNSEALTIRVYGPESKHWADLLNGIDALLDESTGLFDVIPAIS